MASYSQSGEDRIIDYFIGTTGLQNATYLDIGSSHPVWGNNTYLLYRRGLRGVCVDPSPGLADLYKIHRSDDVFIPNAVIAGEEGDATMHLFGVSAINTVNDDNAKQFAGFGFEIKGSCRVGATNLELLCSQIGGNGPDIICIDIEGLDLAVLTHADFTRWRPKVICVEVVYYLPNKEPAIDKRFEQILGRNGYFKYADTYINQIFVDRTFQSRQRLF